jgi:alpha-L-rhamnosidase
LDRSLLLHTAIHKAEKMNQNIEDIAPSRFQGDAWWIWSDEGNYSRKACSDGATYESRWFLKEFDISSPDADFKAAVTADSYYVLWFNGILVCRGPARGDLRHYFYDEVDLRPHLRIGKNILRVLVLDYSPVACFPGHLGAPAAVITYRGGFAFDGEIVDSQDQKKIITDGSWTVFRSEARQFVEPELLFGGFVGYFERFNATLWDKEWKQERSCESCKPSLLYPAKRIDQYRDEAAPYELRKGIVPALKEGEPKVFIDGFHEGGGELSEAERNWIVGVSELVLAPGECRSITLDAGELFTAYPSILLRGKGASVRLIYGEALRLSKKTSSSFSLRPQSRIEDGSLQTEATEDVWSFDRRGKCVGYSDLIECSKEKVEFEPLRWRTFRYVRFDIKAGNYEVVLKSPTFKQCENAAAVVAEFGCSSSWIEEVWERSVRTVRCCTHETFEDCPYYEQLQYVGDSEIISKLHLYLTGDSALSRQALFHFDWSRVPEGITASRYPCRLPQIIPSWSLHWIGMTRDYLLYTGDSETVESLLPGINQVLQWFRARSDQAGLPAKLPYWNFVDWTPGWQRGQPPGWNSGPTCVIGCQFVQALKDAAQICRWLNKEDQASVLELESLKIADSLNEKFWNPHLGVYTDEPDKSGEGGLLTNVWAVCSGVALPKQFPSLKAVLERWAPSNISFFGMYWLFKARRIMGIKTVENHLYPWKEMIPTGLSTWPEDTTFGRSLCHGWSAHPIVECVEGIFGLTVTKPGWAEIKVSPNIGSLKSSNLTIPTPRGLLTMNYYQVDDGFRLCIQCPDTILFSVDGFVMLTEENDENGTISTVWEPPKAKEVLL